MFIPSGQGRNLCSEEWLRGGRLLQKRLQQHVGQGIVNVVVVVALVVVVVVVAIVVVVVVDLKADFFERGYNNMLGKVYMGGWSKTRSNY